MPVKELQLATHWQYTVAAYSHKPVQPLTGKELGQIKNLWRITGGISRTLMNFAIENWKAFTVTVIDMTGTPGCPDVPRVGYLLKHRHVAISMMVQAEIITLEDVNLALEVAKIINSSEVW